VHNNLVSYQATSAWQGPLAVLVDGGTGSAAELFAATLKDNGRATIIGAHTVGSGCGYTNGGIPLTLKHSGVEVKFPDCVRLRADGSNEVAGIAPDVKVGEGRRLDAREVQGSVRRWVLGL
jgi:C-terminal processing protease CtpA/Prc